VIRYVIVEKLGEASGEAPSEVNCGSSGNDITLTVVFPTVLGIVMSGIRVIELEDSAAACSDDKRCISER
jgi:hypothetical protein